MKASQVVWPGCRWIALLLLGCQACTLHRLPPDHSTQAVERGLEKARAGDHRGALVDYNRAIRQDAGNAYAYALRSQSLRALGDDTGAESDIEHVLRLRLEDWDRELAQHPQDAAALAGRAGARSSLGDSDGAIEDYRASLKLRPSHAPTLFELGNAHYRAGDKAAARLAYDQALVADPNLAEAYWTRASVRFDLGDLEGAAADRLKARSIAPTDQVTHRTKP